jgi:hypothetical protein
LDLEDDEDDTAHLAGFGGWEIEDSELKRKSHLVPDRAAYPLSEKNHRNSSQKKPSLIGYATFFITY